MPWMPRSGCASVRTSTSISCACGSSASATRTFREHVAGRSTDKADYGEFLTFIQPPVVSVGHRVLGGRAVAFDAGDTAVVNAGATIVNVQWDFDYDGERFMATRDFSFARDKRSGRPLTSVTRKFDRAGVFRVACRVQDSRGGEGMWTGAVEVS